LNSTKVKNPRN